MKHHTNSDFWFCYRHLPEEIQRRADKAYQLLNQNPRHPSLHFEKVGELWSVRVTLDYREIIEHCRLKPMTAMCGFGLVHTKTTISYWAKGVLLKLSRQRRKTLHPANIKKNCLIGQWFYR